MTDVKVKRVKSHSLPISFFPIMLLYVSANNSRALVLEFT